MTQDHNDPDGTDNTGSTEDQPGPFDSERRREPVFSGFDDDEDVYEEPERDTDSSSIYLDDSEEEAVFDDLLAEDDEDFRSDDSDLEDFTVQRAGTAPQPGPAWEEPDSSTPEESETWLQEDEFEEEAEESGRSWPRALVIDAVIVLLLLTAVGYVLLQQRTASQEEIRRLQAALATTARPEDVSASRTALQEVKQENAGLTATVEQLTRENRRLSDTLAGLETQLEAQQAQLEQQTTAAEKQAQAAAPKPAVTKPAVPEPAAPKPATPSQGTSKPVTPVTDTSKPATPAEKAAPPAGNVPTDGWFVNFGSYGQRNAAESRARELQPTAGKVIVATGTRDGKTFYRVRVVGLGSRDAAEKVARSLEKQYGLPKLWIGQQ